MGRQGGVEECAWGLLTLGSPGTGAFVGIDQVNAGAPVLARLGETFIDLVRAVGPHVSWHALKGRRNKKEEDEAKEEEEEEEMDGRGRREGKVESMSDMKQRCFFCLPGCFLASSLPRPADPLFQWRLA